MGRERQRERQETETEKEIERVCVFLKKLLRKTRKKTIKDKVNNTSTKICFKIIGMISYLRSLQLDKKNPCVFQRVNIAGVSTIVLDLHSNKKAPVQILVLENSTFI